MESTARICLWVSVLVFVRCGAVRCGRVVLFHLSRDVCETASSMYAKASCHVVSRHATKVEALSPGLLGKEKDPRYKAKTAFASNYCGGTV